MAKTPSGPPPKQTGTTSKPGGGSKANPTPVKGPAGGKKK